MGVVSGGQAPYPPTAALMAVINAFRERSPRTPVTAENIVLISGVSESLAPRTLQGMKLLDLLDDAGEPTADLIALAQAGRNEFSELLADVVRRAYPEVFSYCDPATADPADIRDLFQRYKPASMRERAVRLFYGLCVEAGIIAQAPVITTSPFTAKAKGDKRGTPTSTTRVKTTKTAPERREPADTPKAPVVNGQLPEIVGALVAKLPARGEPWTAEDAEWWLQMAEMAFPREYGFDPKPRSRP